MIVAIGVFGVTRVQGEPAPHRPALETAQPIVSCKLQSLKVQIKPQVDRPLVPTYGVQRATEDTLANYERTPLGGAKIQAGGNRQDPWVRLLLLDPNRPVVLDVAIFIGAKPFRKAREAWIDELVTATKAGADTSVNQSGDGQVVAKEENSTRPADSQPVEVAEASVPAARVQTRRAPTMRQRLMNYLAASGAPVDRDEVRWLIAEWGSGPNVVLLAPALSWQRATVDPLLALLDRDRDGVLSAAEIASADAWLQRADVNQDDVVELSEIRRVTSEPPMMSFVAGAPLLVPLDEATDWDALATTVGRVYGRATISPSSGATARSANVPKTDHDGNPAWDANGLQTLAEQPADVTLRIDFAVDDNRAAGLSVLGVSPTLGKSNEIVTATTDVVTCDLGAHYIEFSAAQRPAKDTTDDASATQVAIGAVVDGNPLLRLADTDQDQRLTARERQQVHELLSALDRDGDGQIAANEMPIPLRVAFTLGPHVHEVLSASTGAARTIAPRNTVTAPAWFLSMDKNGDRDLSRSEFLGTKEQFQQLDANGDGLLSVAEALKTGNGK